MAAKKHSERESLLSLRQRLLSRIVVDPDGPRLVDDAPCWFWTGAKNQGYGVIGVGRRCVKSTHRLVYATWLGEIPEDLDIDHLCRNPACCNPCHLEPVTPRENIARGVGRGAQALRTGVCINGHPQTPENMYIYPDGKRRYCRPCVRAGVRRYRARKRKEQKQ